MPWTNAVGVEEGKEQPKEPSSPSKGDHAIKSILGVEIGVQIEEAPVLSPKSKPTKRTNDQGEIIEELKEFVKPQIGFVIYKNEIKSWSLWRGAITECYAMILFLFFTIGTVASTSKYSKINGFEGLDSARQWMISSVFGTMISILVYILAPVSGGNLNPAVSISLALTKKISPLRCFIYIIAQCIGATIGCLLVKIIDEQRYNAVGGAINSVSKGYTNGGAFLAEFIGTSLLILAVSSVVDGNNDQYDRINMKQSHGISSIGFAVTMAHCVLIPITNCSINPARSFGASLVYGEFPQHWIFWFAPIFGGIFSTLFYEIVIMDREFK
mmetsp:Transcript_31965/g.41086  ORF Transcript_31965/g.41086 Transcript_31965/m.41086 type:complete len:327 (+) Transcript_31965:73-1053(+)